MQIQINTDHNIEGHEALAAQVNGVVESALGRFSDQITRVEVHLRDENSHKGGPNDNRCMMEARPEGRQPIAVTHQAATLEQAVGGAANKFNHPPREQNPGTSFNRKPEACAGFGLFVALRARLRLAVKRGGLFGIKAGG